MEDDDIIIMYGKTDPDRKFQECTIKLGPSSKAKKRTTMIMFEAYHNNNCDIYLAIEQSPYTFFDKDVSTVVRANIFVWQQLI